MSVQAAEVWRPVPGFDGYQVSTLGRVISRRRTRPVVLKPWVTPKGYHFVRLWTDALHSHPKAVHRLVAQAFIGPRPEGMEVRHLDGNPDNNGLDNLTYGSHSQNMHDIVTHGNHSNAKKTHCPQGHEYSPENTIQEPRGRRCATCKRAHMAATRRRARAREAVDVAAS